MPLTRAHLADAAMVAAESVRLEAKARYTHPSQAHKLKAELEHADELDAAAAELRKTCAGCLHFKQDKGGSTPFGHVEPFGKCGGQRPIGWARMSIEVPYDGSGGCTHGWEPK